MRKFIIASIVALTSVASFAQTADATVTPSTDNSIKAGDGSTAIGALSTYNSSTGGGNINSNNSTSTTTNGGVGSAQNVYQTGAKQVILSTNPAMIAPLTTSGMDTCLGSVTGGLSLPGLSASGGSTVTDKNCVMLKNSKRLQELGLNDAALMLMVMSDPAIKEALITVNPEVYSALTSKAEKAAEIRAAEAAKKLKAEDKPSFNFTTLFN